MKVCVYFIALSMLHRGALQRMSHDKYFESVFMIMIYLSFDFDITHARPSIASFSKLFEE